MNKISILLVGALLSINSVFAQDISNKTLLTVNGQEIKVAEFTSVYEKNLDLVQDPEQKKIDNYLPLFISYKSKLMQAHNLGLDTMKVYSKELAGYRKELAAPYFKDPKEEEKLLKEAWERSKYDLKVSHILLQIKEDASPADSLKKYKKLMAIRKEIKSGKISFADAAKKYSEGPSNVKGGALGWMSVFQMVYPFESGAYNTPVGEISKPVRSSFGYHLIQVNDKRESKGKVQIAHIFLKAAPGAKADSINEVNKALMDTIYTQIKVGKEFADMARRYSDDKRSGMNGGVLPVLKAGKLMPVMDNLAFGLQEGEVSEPFQTQYGWHILKVLKKYPVLSYEESKEELKKELSKDNRSKYIDKSVVNHLLSKYKIKKNNKKFTSVEKAIDTSYLKPNWKYTTNVKDGVVLTIEDKKINASDYISFLENNPVNARNKFSLKYVLQQKRKAFVEAEVLKYYDENLENEFPKFKEVMTNYREGILIYNLMNLKIWDKSFVDSTGLATYYDEHKTEYMWPERADLLIAKCFNENAAKKVLKYMKRGKSKEYIEKKINKDAQVGVTFQTGIITPENDVLPEGFEWKKGVSKIYKKSDTDFVIVDIKKFVEPQVKTLEETRNRVRTDYQNYLEKEWNKELKNDYKAIVNDEVLKAVKEKYNQ
jgi:peptidyl-prolyl cis-trans isomerase SurA